MVNKTISAVVLSASVVIAILASSQPNNILFLFISPDKFITTARVILALGMVFLTFRGYLGSRKLREYALAGGLLLTALGLATLVITPLTNAIYDQVKLLDAMILAQAGIVFTSCALSLPAKLPKVRIQKAPARAHAKTTKLRGQAA